MMIPLVPVPEKGVGHSFDARVSNVRSRANWMRLRLLKMIVDAGQGHPGGDLSATDIIATLYFDILRFDAARPDAPERDRFVMSKGHCTGALYSALAGAGYFPEVETNTGPLGHGLPVAVGIAIAAQIDKTDYRVFVLTGDGELQEGSMWEAAMLAGHRGLGQLTVIVDRNRLQQGARTEDTNALEPLADKWLAFGWDVVETDGHNHAGLLQVFDAACLPRSKPLCIIANTQKGHGVSFMEDQASWHHGVPNAAQYAQAIAELEAEMTA